MMVDRRRNGGYGKGNHYVDEEVPYQDIPLVSYPDDLAHSKNPRALVDRFYSDGTSFEHPHHSMGWGRLFLLSLGALGTIYGDIGTSPLYVYTAVFSQLPVFDDTDILGAQCLITYSLIFVVCIKYIGFILEADKAGEGGIFSLVSLIPPDHSNTEEQVDASDWVKATKRVAVFSSFIGASFLLGDGAITPAISVLSAIEGIETELPDFEPFVVPVTCIILLLLFMMQRWGTQTVSMLFGPIMVVWFVAIGLTGMINISALPDSLWSFNPYYGYLFFARHGVVGWLLLGAVVLSVTGVEALYADLGHFGRIPVRVSWTFIAFPCLLLNYLGQASILTLNPAYVQNTFFYSVPSAVHWPMFVLATLSAIIASQAMITGTFSLISQAISLDFFPPLVVKHTSQHVVGQIYIPAINYPLMVATIALVAIFQSSSHLASAYGFAVTSTVTITTLLYMVVCILRWHISPWLVIPGGLFFLTIDLAYFTANSVKIPSGGWVPMSFGVVFVVIMTVWKLGRVDVGEVWQNQTAEDGAIFDLLEELGKGKVQRTPGTGLYFASAGETLPNVLFTYYRMTKSIPERVILLTLEYPEVPFIANEKHIKALDIGYNVYSVLARFGFMEASLSLSMLLEEISTCDFMRERSISIGENEVRCFIMNETLVLGESHQGPLGWWTKVVNWRLAMYNFMSHQSIHPAVKTLDIPPELMVEVGSKLVVL